MLPPSRFRSVVLLPARVALAALALSSVSSCRYNWSRPVDASVDGPPVDSSPGDRSATDGARDVRAMADAVGGDGTPKPARDATAADGPRAVDAGADGARGPDAQGDAARRADAGGTDTAPPTATATAMTTASGCSDQTRDSFKDVKLFPDIAGCEALWPAGSMVAPGTGEACGNSLGPCQVPADACAAGWHVCGSPPYGATDISAKVSAEECMAQPGAFAIALGDKVCTPCDSGSGAACCGTLCVSQNGSCIYPGMTSWFGVIDNHVNLCGDIVSSHASRGVLCCRSVGLSGAARARL